MTPTLRRKLVRMLERLDVGCRCRLMGPQLCVLSYGAQGCTPACVTKKHPDGCDRKANDGWCECPKGNCECPHLPAAPCEHIKAREKVFDKPSYKRVLQLLGIRKDGTTGPITFDEWYELMIMTQPSEYLDPELPPLPMLSIRAEARVATMDTREHKGWAIRHPKDLRPEHPRLDRQGVNVKLTYGNNLAKQSGLNTLVQRKAG